MGRSPKVASVFSKIWNCENDDLLVSFDGASIGIPPEVTNRSWNRKPWFHCDQSYTKLGMDCVQGWVTSLAVEQGDATLAFLEGSHLCHADIAKKHHITGKSNWFQVTPEIFNTYVTDYGCEERRLMCPAGSLVLWDSRTLHCGSEPYKGRQNAHLRNVCYVCFKPKLFSSVTNNKKRKRYFDEQRATRHSPANTTVFPKMPHTFGKPVLEMAPIDPPVITEFGHKLIV